MAGIIFAKNSAVNDDLWKVNDQVVRSILMDTATEKNKDDELVKALFNEKKSKKFGRYSGANVSAASSSSTTGAAPTRAAGSTPGSASRASCSPRKSELWLARSSLKKPASRSI